MFEEKYIELILKKCLKIEGQPLFINYNKINKNFVKKIEKYAKSIGVCDIYLDERDLNKEREVILNTNLEDIQKNELFNCKKWDE